MATALPSIDAFIELVNKSGIVEANRFSAYLEKCRASGGLPPDARKLADGMVRDAILTQFQAQQILAGKWKGFFVGKYKILEKLGHGGMGTVYLAEHKFMKRLVAVKVLPASKAKEESSRERFYREAKAIAALDHPNIVRAYDIDKEMSADGKELHFIVMEYVDGASLHDIVRTRKAPLDPDRAMHYVWQAANGLHHAFQIGLVHRDIKPGNLLVDRNGVVKLLDLGLARFFYDDDDNLTKKFDENVLGTADYLAPEQAVDSHEADIRADIYSLGGTLYFMLTGKSPFDEGTVAQKLIWHQTRRPRSVRELRPDVPDAVVAILEKMMQKNKDDRYQTPAELAAALEPWSRAVYPPSEAEIPQLSPAARSMAGVSTVDAVGKGGFIQVSTSLPTRRGMGGPATPFPAPPSPPPAPVYERAAGRSGGQAPLIAEIPRPAPVTALTPGTEAPPRPPAAAPEPTPAPPAGPAKSVGPPVARLAPMANGEAAEPVRPGDNFSWSSVMQTAEAPAFAEETSRSSRSRLAAKPVRKRLNLAEAINNLTRRQLILLASAAGGIVVMVIATIVLLAIRPGSGPSGGGAQALAAGRQVHYVSKSKASPGDFDTISAALAHANPGDTIVVRDQETYEESIAFTHAGAAKKDVVLEARKNDKGDAATLRSPSGEPALLIERVEGITVRGFNLDGDNRVEDLIRVAGACPGLTLDDLNLRGFRLAGIRLEGATGAEHRKIKLQKLRITCQAPGTGCSAIAFGPVIKAGSQRTGHVVLRECWIEGPCDAAVRLGAEVYYGLLERNVFTGGKKAAILYPADAPRHAHLDLHVVNNTFHQFDAALLLQQFPLLSSRIELQNNLFYQVARAPGAVENVIPEKLEHILTGDGNVRDAGGSQAGNVATLPGLVVKADAFELPTTLGKGSPEPLRFPQSSKLATAGVKGMPVGALPPLP